MSDASLDALRRLGVADCEALLRVIEGRPAPNTHALRADCVSLYVETVDGFMPRNERPKTLRASTLGRVPPFQGESSCI